MSSQRTQWAHLSAVAVGEAGTLLVIGVLQTNVKMVVLSLVASAMAAAALFLDSVVKRGRD